MIASARIFIAIALLTAPLLAEIDLAGNWDSRWHEDYIEIAPGPDVVDYSGLPINDEGRARALSYSASVLSLPERQCLYYTPEYLVGSPFRIGIRAEADPVTGKTVAWKISGAVDRSPLTIWMDGRPHPSDYAPHTFAGFTTGELRLSGGGDEAVPHYLPDRNPFTDEVTKLYRIPAEAVTGGAETMYPEFRKKLKDNYVAPEKCVRYCCGWGGNTAGLGCITGGR
jgi:hypothetical protein